MSFSQTGFSIICLDKVLDHVGDGVDRILELVERVALHGADLLLRILRLAEKIRQIQFIEVGSIAARGLEVSRRAVSPARGGELRAQVVRQALAEDVFIERFAVFCMRPSARRPRRAPRRRAGRTCLFCVVFAVRDAEAVGQRPRRSSRSPRRRHSPSRGERMSDTARRSRRRLRRACRR